MSSESSELRQDSRQAKVPTVALLTICTGKYEVFLDQFLTSFRENFAPGHVRTFFVFGDSKRIGSDVKNVWQEKLGWPLDTMMRFQMFNSISAEIARHDFVYFMNVNLCCETKVDAEEVFPTQGDGLMGVIHPGYYATPLSQLPYERRPSSCLCLPADAGRYYFQGCMIGGKSEKFLEMSLVLADMINRDLSNGIVPVWHDESAMNWYYSSRNIMTLPPSFAFPENTKLPFPRRVVQLDKSRFGGHLYLRG